MVVEIIVFRILIILLFLGTTIFLYRSVSKPKKQKEVDVDNLSGKDLEEYVSKLKELIIKAENEYNSGIESAQSKLQMYKDQLENVTKLKTKTKDL